MPGAPRPVSAERDGLGAVPAPRRPQSRGNWPGTAGSCGAAAPPGVSVPHGTVWHGTAPCNVKVGLASCQEPPSRPEEPPREPGSLHPPALTPASLAPLPRHPMAPSLHPMASSLCPMTTLGSLASPILSHTPAVGAAGVSTHTHAQLSPLRPHIIHPDPGPHCSFQATLEGWRFKAQSFGVWVGAPALVELC